MLNNVLITEEIVYKNLSSLKINQAHEDDRIVSIVLKQISSETGSHDNLYMFNV